MSQETLQDSISTTKIDIEKVGSNDISNVEQVIESWNLEHYRINIYNSDGLVNSLNDY